jgi:multimeric flavodoxin WrbA
MSKILVVCGSPRKGGNTDTLLSEVVRGAKEGGAEVETVFLREKFIGPCRGCAACLRQDVEWCVQADDMIELYSKILESDAIVLGTPVYWWGPSAQMKAFFDRWYALLGKEKATLSGKQAAVVCVMGDEEPETARHVIGMFKDAFHYLAMPFVSQLVVTAHERGEVINNKDALSEAWHLGNYLA